MSNDATNPHPPVSGGYISLIAHIWVDDDGKLIRGTIEDAHTGTRLAIDISALAALLRESLAYARVWNAQEVQNSSDEIPGQGPSDSGGVGGA